MIQFPDPPDMIAMAPEDLAWFVLAYAKQEAGLHRGNFTGTFERRSSTQACRQALSEAFAWLETQQLLIPQPGVGSRGNYFVSRRGQSLDTRSKYESFRHVAGFPVQRLHARIREKAMPSFIRGDFGPAVLLAFVEVEVAVRVASGITDLVGVKLMHAAFAKDGGRLTDLSADGGEQTAIANLFAGAIGLFKNPHSHRSPTITNEEEVGDLLILASRLLRIVEERALIGG